MTGAQWRNSAARAGMGAVFLGCAGCLALPAAPIVVAHASVLAPLILNHTGLIVASDAAQTLGGLPTLAASASAAQSDNGPGYDW
ncbi:MAG TPA: hypothetical protein VKV28_04230 [Candidatus Binataceae bacterium]|nr:hypothetical protein [Candidatus Binataceae bacterium]